MARKNNENRTTRMQRETHALNLALTRIDDKKPQERTGNQNIDAISSSHLVKQISFLPENSPLRTEKIEFIAKLVTPSNEVHPFNMVYVRFETDLTGLSQNMIGIIPVFNMNEKMQPDEIQADFEKKLRDAQARVSRQ